MARQQITNNTEPKYIYMVNLFSIIDYKNGKLYNVNSMILLGVKLEDQLLNLMEDINQINYPDKKAFIDIGWYPVSFEVNKHSHFSLKVISNETYDWDTPLFERNIKTIEELKTAIEECINYVDSNC